MTRWRQFLACHSRVVLCGRSNVGKSTLARQADRPTHNTGVQGVDGDTLQEVTWKDTPDYWLNLLAHDPGPFLLEGTQAVRVLRTGLRDRGWEPDGVAVVLGVYDPGDLPPDEVSGDHAEDRRRGRVLESRAKGQQTIMEDYERLRFEAGARSELLALTLNEWEAEC